MGDGLEGIFDLVEAAFGGEYGRLRLLLAVACLVEWRHAHPGIVSP